jgi:hypothetical protein
MGFSNGLGSASHFDESSELEMELTTLDSLQASQPTFIKIDIEGMQKICFRRPRGNYQASPSNSCDFDLSSL